MTATRTKPRSIARRWFCTSLSVAFLFGAASPPISPLPVARAAEPSPEEEPVGPVTREAIEKGLAWLAKNQQSDGSWEQGHISSTAVPSLAVMAFLARGHVPGQGPYGNVINKAIDFVLKNQQDDGLLSSGHGNASMYEHGISASMLSEAYGMIDDARKQKIEKAIAKAVQLILDAQRPDGEEKKMPHTGGWRYQFRSRDSDISVTGWQLMALRGAANCGATVPRDALDAGREFVRRCSVDTGGFAYQATDRKGPNPPRTGTGIVALEMLGDHLSDEAIAGGDYLLEHIPDGPGSGEHYYYGVYYCSQALYQLGGKYWENGYPKLRDGLLAVQDHSRGTWSVGKGQEETVGDAYRTSMAVLALCVPYRYLPLYQK